MRNPIRVIVLGTGQMGSGIARLVLNKPGLELVGMYARRPHRVGMEVGQVLGLDRQLGIFVAANLDRLLDEAQAEIAIQATCSTVTDAIGEISTLLRHSVNVISIAEEMAFPKQRSAPMAEEMHWQSVKQGVSILGTGINPGFILDLLIIALTGVCVDIQSIKAQRVNDLSPYGPSVLMSQGIGLSPEEFETGVQNGTVIGHVGFAESMHMLAKAVGWQLDRIEETRRPIVANATRQTEYVTVQAGQVAGCDHSAVAYKGGEAVIHFQHPQQIQPQVEGVETGDSIEIHGTPNIHLAGSPEIPGGVATCALAVNMIPQVLKARPGLYNMAELPVPAAMLSDARTFLPEELIELSHV